MTQSAATADTTGLKARLFLVFATGYFLSYLYRTVNAVLSPALAQDIGLEATALGVLTGAYFIAFAAFQLPLGILLDRYGPRRVEAVLLVIAAAGAGLFAIADSLTSLIIARALIGLGVSACLMAGFKALVLWFPRERLPFFNGLFMVSGGLGAIAAATPVQLALQVTDWRGVFLLLAVLTLAVAGLIFTATPDKPAPAAAAPQSLGDLLRGFGEVFRAPLFIRIAPLVAVAQGVFLGYQSLWAGAWLRDVSGLAPRDAADHVLAAAAAMCAGFFLVGFIADRLARRGIPPLTVGVGGISLFMLVQAGLVSGLPVSPWLLWIGFGLLGTASSATYAVLSQSLPTHLSGRSNTAINLVAFVGAFVVQSGVGSLLEHLGPLPGGSATPEAHRMALGGLVGLQVLALGWFFWRRPKV